MAELSKRVLIIDLPECVPELRTHFAALASRDGFRQRFAARDAQTGDQFVVQFAHESDPKEAA